MLNQSHPTYIFALCAGIAFAPLTASAEISADDLKALDSNKNGRFDRGAELDALMARRAEFSLAQETIMKVLANHPDQDILLSDLNDKIINSACEGKSRFLLQNSGPGISLTNPHLIDQSKKGAKFSYTNDREKGKTSWSADGILVWQPKQNPCPYLRQAKRPKGPIWDGRAYALYLQFDGEGSSTDPDKSDLRLGAMAEFQLSGGAVGTQIFNVNSYYRTDFQGEAEIYGIDAVYKPLWISSSAIQPTVEVNASYQSVQKAGNSGLAAGTDYGWIGAKLGFATKIAPKRTEATFEMHYSAHWDVINDETATMARAEFRVPLDEDGVTNLILSYDKGTDYATLKDVDATTVSLSFKY